jgi:hypothetical protein
MSSVHFCFEVQNNDILGYACMPDDGLLLGISRGTTDKGSLCELNTPWKSMRSMRWTSWAATTSKMGLTFSGWSPGSSGQLSESLTEKVPL